MKGEPSLVSTTNDVKKTKTKKRKKLKKEPFTIEEKLKQPLCHIVSSNVRAKRVKTDPEAALPTSAATSQNFYTKQQTSKQSFTSIKTPPTLVGNVTMKEEPLPTGRQLKHSSCLTTSKNDEEHILLAAAGPSSVLNTRESKGALRKKTALLCHPDDHQKAPWTAQKKSPKEELTSVTLNRADSTRPPLDAAAPLLPCRSPSTAMVSKSMPTLASGPIVKSKSLSEPLIKPEVVPITVPLQSLPTPTANGTTSQPARTGSLSDDVDGSLKLCFTYGMVVVERNSETNEAEWIACKFCAIFGCKTRKRHYIMAQGKPFDTDKLKTHLSLEHETRWRKYRKADDVGKAKVFKGTKLPKREFFQARVLELKKNMRNTLMKEEMAEKLQKRYEELAKQQKDILISGTFGKCELDWTGRSELRTETVQMPNARMTLYGESRSKNNVVERLRQRKWIKYNRLPFLFLPKEIQEVVLNGILAETSMTVGKSGVFFHPEVYLCQNEQTKGKKWDTTSRSISWKDYLLITVVAYLSRGLSIFTVEEILEPMLNMVAPGWIDAEDSMKGVVWRIGNSVCAESLRLLREVMKTDINWLLVPTFASCEAMGEDGVEVLIPVLHRGSELFFMHLISVRDGENVGDSVMNILHAVCPNWKQKIGGFYSHIAGQDIRRKVIEEKIISSLGEHAKMSPLPKFEKGQKEVQELPVEKLCVMSNESVMKTLSMFIRPYVASLSDKSEENVLKIMQADHKGILSGELLKEQSKGKVQENWKKVKFGTTRDLPKYLHGLQVIWRQEVSNYEGDSERFMGGFLDRHAPIARCGIVKDWRCESVVDAVMERTAYARNMTRLKCMKGAKMKFNTEHLVQGHSSRWLNNFEAAHMFDANWSNMKARSLMWVIDGALKQIA